MTISALPFLTVARCATRNVRDSVRINALDAADWLASHYGSEVALRKLRAHAAETMVD